MKQYNFYLIIFALFFNSCGSDQIISSEEGEWCWLPNTETSHRIIQVHFENEPWEKLDIFVIEHLLESSFLIHETATNDDESSSPNNFTTHNFQLASLPFADSFHGDLTAYYDTNN